MADVAATTITPAQSHNEYELQSRDLSSLEGQESASTDHEETLSRPILLKLLSCSFSFLFAGTNDGSLGALIPYILRTYNISTKYVAIIYAVSFLGWFLAALTNSYIIKYIDTGAILAIGAALQLVSHVLRLWGPAFGLFAASFFLQTLGMALQDSHSNTFVSTVNGAHRWLGFIHAQYALGCLIAPFVATSIAKSMSTRWFLFYYFLLALGFLNLLLVAYSFRDEMKIKPGQSHVHSSVMQPPRDAARRSNVAFHDMQETLKLPSVWLLSLFFFFFLGAGVTASGWVVEFLVRVRHGSLSEMGYVPAGFSGGMFLGRLLLAEPTYRLGERRMLLVYCVLLLALEIVFWLVPNIAANIAAITLFGFFFGPLFATGISVASKLFPKRLHPTALGFVFVLAQAGGCVFPAITGLIAASVGVQVMQPILVALLVGTAISWVLFPRTPRRDD